MRESISKFELKPAGAVLHIELIGLDRDRLICVQGYFDNHMKA